MRERSCLIREAVLQFPVVPEETTVTLEEVWDFAEDVDDGWDVYPAGEYRHVYKLTLLPENPLVSETTDCRRTWTEVLDRVTPLICQPSEPLWDWWQNREEANDYWEGEFSVRKDRLVILATGRQGFSSWHLFPVAPLDQFFFGFYFYQFKGSYKSGHFGGIRLWNPDADIYIRFHIHPVFQVRGSLGTSFGGWHIDRWSPGEKPRLLKNGRTSDPQQVSVPIAVLSDGKTLQFFVKHRRVYQLKQAGPWLVYLSFGAPADQKFIYDFLRVFFAIPQGQP